jgi:hypothetical protein
LHRANIAHKECEWKDGDRGGLAEWEQTERKKKEKVVLDINRPSHGRSYEQIGKINTLRSERTMRSTKWMAAFAVIFMLTSNFALAQGHGNGHGEASRKTRRR